MMKEMGSRPDDFSVRYKWSEGTMPPPYYYEYTIRIGPGASGSIDFLPDYPMHNPPIWTERFDVAQSALDRLYSMIVEKGVFGRSWTEIDDGRIGGSLEWMEVTTAGEKTLVPSVIEEAELVRDIYGEIKALVPSSPLKNGVSPSCTLRGASQVRTTLGWQCWSPQRPTDPPKLPEHVECAQKQI